MDTTACAVLNHRYLALLLMSTLWSASVLGCVITTATGVEVNEFHALVSELPGQLAVYAACSSAQNTSAAVLPDSPQRWSMQRMAGKDCHRT